MKKTLSLLVTFFTLSSSSLFALGADAFSTPAGKDDWKLAFSLYSRVTASTGQGIDKDQLAGKKAGYGAAFRIRPGMVATNGNFVFGALLGTDLYMGKGTKGTMGGSNQLGLGVGDYNTAILQLRQLYMGYQWDNGVYTSWGVQDASLPYLNADSATGIVTGWKNDAYDVNVFYFQLMEGSIYKARDDGGLFGIKADIAPAAGFHITPFVAGLWQGADVGMEINTGWSGSQSIDSINYTSGAKFVDGVGLYAGFDLGYTAPFGLYVNATAIYLYGKNKAHIGGASTPRYNQTRNGFAALVAVGYAIEEVMKAELFVDFRSGSKNINKNGTNASVNGGLIEYDANTPPLLIMYNAGSSRQGYQYSETFGDGYAYTDRGALSVGADANFNLAMFNVGVALGYGWYSAPRSGNSSSIGFEFDLTASYNIMSGLSMFLEAGLLAPGKGVKQELEDMKGTALRAQMPWLVNLGFKYAL